VSELKGLVIAVPPAPKKYDETSTVPAPPQPMYTRIRNTADHPITVTLLNRTPPFEMVIPPGEDAVVAGGVLHSISVRGGQSPRKGLVRVIG
jgi:hypothetical protein